MRRSLARVTATGIMAVGMLLLTGCSMTSVLDGAKLEETVSTELSTQLGGEWTVTCPEDVPIAKGGTFTCEATSADGQTEQINVTQDDEEGNVTWEVPASTLDTALLQDQVAASLAEQVGGEWTVTCPSDIPMEQGGTFTCDVASADGQTAVITVTQTDDQGNVTWESQ